MSTRRPSSHGSRIQANWTFSSRAIGSDYEYSRWLLLIEKWLPPGGGRAFRIDLGAGRDPLSRSPVSADVSVRVDTPLGLFDLSLAYLYDHVHLF